MRNQLHAKYLFSGSRVLITPQQTEWQYVENITDMNITQLNTPEV